MLHKINAVFFTRTFSHALILISESKPVTEYFVLIKKMNDFLQQKISPVNLLKPNLVAVKMRYTFITCPQIDT